MRSKEIILLKLQHERGLPNPGLFVLCYRPGLRAAFGIVSCENPNEGPLALSTYGDRVNSNALRKAWRTWVKDPSALDTKYSSRFVDSRFLELEWTPRVAIRSFVRWVNSKK